MAGPLGRRAPSWSSDRDGSLTELGTLHDVAAVRERCNMVYRWVADGRSPHFTLDESRLTAVAGYVADVTREAYPDLKIPYHSRWRHFSAGGVDRWSELAARIDAAALERARIAVDLATVSVLLDAGAGNAWRYHDRKTGHSFTRSEGLAVASLDMFSAGLFSSDPAHPLRVDHAALARIDAATLARHFQVDGENPLVGLEQRSVLLRRLGAALSERPDMFGRTPARPGNLVDYLLSAVLPHRPCLPRCSRVCPRSGRPGSHSMGLPSAMPATIPPRARKAAPIASSRSTSSRNG
jgi:hypothetical protein